MGGGLVKMRSTGYEAAIKRELVRLDCKKSIKFCALLPSERSNCLDHKKQRQIERAREQGVRCDRREEGENKRENTERLRAQHQTQRTMRTLCILIRSLN